MMQCWSKDPEQRPSFAEICKIIGDIVSVGGKPVHKLGKSHSIDNLRTIDEPNATKPMASGLSDSHLRMQKQSESKGTHVFNDGNMCMQNQVQSGKNANPKKLSNARYLPMAGQTNSQPDRKTDRKRPSNVGYLSMSSQIKTQSGRNTEPQKALNDNASRVNHVSQLVATLEQTNLHPDVARPNHATRKKVNR